VDIPFLEEDGQCFLTRGRFREWEMSLPSKCKSIITGAREGSSAVATWPGLKKQESKGGGKVPGGAGLKRTPCAKENLINAAAKKKQPLAINPVGIVDPRQQTRRGCSLQNLCK